jgi:ArsR family transcriptional regulator, arsenate/arsenite/antimonite-responsive transcriptional repressor
MRSNLQEGPGDGWRDYMDLKRMLRALGDSVRLNIVHALASADEMKVTDLAAQLAVSQPLVSWHLTILRRMEFVRTRRQGREVYCSLDATRYQQCVAMLAAVIGEQPARQPARVGPVSSGRRRKDSESRC